MQNLNSSNSKSGKSLVGLIFLVIGCLLLIKTLDIIFIPGWVFSWPVFLIIIGCFVGSRQGYERPSAFVPIIIGIIFLSNKAIPDLELGRFIWPMMIIGIGIWMIMGRRSKRLNNLGNWDQRVGQKEESFPTESVNPPVMEASSEQNTTQNDQTSGSHRQYVPIEDKIESVSVFGGVKKNIVSKNFKGGEVVNFFGGTEINLMQADISGRVYLEVVQVFGGSKIIVPANWTVHSEMVAVFGGIEDKRPPQMNLAPDKVLVIQGTSIFGGIDIKSF